MSALDTAVFWTEYVIRHGNETNNSSPAMDLNFYEYCLLDVFGIFFSFLLILLYLVYRVKKLVTIIHFFTLF